MKHKIIKGKNKLSSGKKNLIRRSADTNYVRVHVTFHARISDSFYPFLHNLTHKIQINSNNLAHKT